MNKKAMIEKKVYKKVTIIMILLLVMAAVLPVFHMTAVQAVEKTGNLVQLQIGRKRITKKTYRMEQGTKKKLNTVGKAIKSVQFYSNQKNVASISKTGVIHAKHAGTAKITAVVKIRTSQTKQEKKKIWLKVKVVKSEEQDTSKIPDRIEDSSGTEDLSETEDSSGINSSEDTILPTDIIDTVNTTDISNSTSNDTNLTDSNTESENASNILIAYFTRSGNTETLANRIQEKTEGTKVKIETVKDYSQDYSRVYDEAMKEKEENARPELKTIVDNMAEYDTIFIGYPIWHGDTPMAIRTFLESYDFTGKKIIPFCSSGSSSPEISFESVKASAAGADVLDGFWTRGTEVANVKDEIDEWIDRLGIFKKHEEEKIMGNKIHITVGDTTTVFTAELANNSSAEALKDLLLQGPLTISMSDYANMEKVGSIGTSLPRNDEHIVTEAGDIILYQGNSLVIYYDTNTWNFTRIGKIENVTKDQLLEALGNGDVTVTITLA